MGSFRSSGGREIGRFEASDDNGKIYLVIEFELTLQSNEIHPDRMARRLKPQRYFELPDGSSVVPIPGEIDAFRIVRAGKLIRKA